MQKGDGNSVDVSTTITKQFFNKIHSSTKLTPIQASLKTNEGYVYHYLLNKQTKIEPKIQVDNLVITADLKTTFSKRDATHCSYKMFKITEIINDTIPSYRIDN